MARKPKTEIERQQLRTQIIDAARELFVAQGIENVTMRAIANKIGYSATSIYLHFADRESLLRAICDTDFLALAAWLKEILQISDPVDRMMALGQGYAKFALMYPNHYRLMFMSKRQMCDPALSSLEQNNPEQDAYYQLKLVVNEVFQAGRFREELQDYELIAQTIWAGIHGVCSLEITLSQDVWINWRAIEDRLSLMQQVLFKGLLKESK
jgi:AcrR family transcriptional regulator